MDTQTQPAAQETVLKDLVDLRPYEKSLNNARTWLYLIAGLYLVAGLYEYFTTDDNFVAAVAFGIDAFLGLIFLSLGLWSRQKPFLSFTIALILYLVVMVALMAFDPSTILRGIILKILIIVALSKAISSARQYEEVKAATS